MGYFEDRSQLLMLSFQIQIQQNTSSSVHRGIKNLKASNLKAKNRCEECALHIIDKAAFSAVFQLLMV
jgi:hypothetical protein